MKSDNLTAYKDQKEDGIAEKNNTLSDPEMSGFFTSTQRWGFTTSQQMVLLGMPRRSVFYRWKSGELADIPHNTRMRVGYVSGIDKALCERFAAETQRLNWISQVNSAFDGQSPFDVMLNGQMEDLQNVWKYLSV